MAKYDEAKILDMELSAKLTDKEKFCLKALLVDGGGLSVRNAFMFSREKDNANPERAQVWYRSDKVQAYLRVLKRMYMVGKMDDMDSLKNVELRSREDYVKMYQQIGDNAVDEKTKMAAYAKVSELMGWKAKQEQVDENQIKYHLPLRCFDCSLNKMREEGILYFDEVTEKWKIKEY